MENKKDKGTAERRKQYIQEYLDKKNITRPYMFNKGICYIRFTVKK